MLGWGFFADDYGHQIALSGEAELPSMRPWSLYDFGDLGDGEWSVLPPGTFPWWTSPDWKVRFFRPLASLSLWLDHAVFGSLAFGYHLVGLALFAVSLALAWRLYRALGLAPRAALLALAFLACEDGSVTAVGWLANRNTLLEAIFVTAAVLAAVRPEGPRVALAFACALLAMLCKESGIVAAPLVAAAVVWRRRLGGASARARNAALALGIALPALYLAWLFGQGYGARGPFYPTPWREPRLFAANLALLAVSAPAVLVLPFPIDAVHFVPGATLPVVALGLALGVPLVLAVRRHARGAPAFGLLAFWVGITLLPQGSAPVSDRLVFVPGIAGAALLGAYVHAVLAGEGDSSTRRARIGAWLVTLAATVVSGVALVARGVGMLDATGLLRRAVVESDVGPPELGLRDAVLLQTPAEIGFLTPLTVWVVETRDLEVRFWPLQMGRRGLVCRRTGEATLEIESTDAPFAAGAFEQVFLSATPRVAVGDRWSTPLFEVEALRVEAGLPRRIRLRFPDGLDRPQLRFLAWDGERMSPVALPAIGAELVLETVAPPHPFLP